MAKKKTAAQLEQANARARQRYADDADYRERKIAATNAYYALHSDELNAKQRQRYATDGEFRERKLASRRTRKLMASLEKYGIPIEAYERMLASQNGRCRICQRDFSRAPCFDHDHVTGELRGLLCDRCNTGIGHFKDNPVWLRRAADHVERRGASCDAGQATSPHDGPWIGDDAGRWIRRAILQELLRPPGPRQPPPANNLQQIVRVVVDKAGELDAIAIEAVFDRIGGSGPQPIEAQAMRRLVGVIADDLVR
jgi:hypothetical protein